MAAPTRGCGAGRGPRRSPPRTRSGRALELADEHATVALDAQPQQPLAGDRARPQRAVVVLDRAAVDVERQDQRQPAVGAGLQARLEQAPLAAAAQAVE